MFTILCETAAIIIGSYESETMMKRWLSQLSHHREKQVKHIITLLNELKSAAKVNKSYDEIYADLLLYLDNQRYFYSVKKASALLRSLLQDAMIAVLNFNDDDMKSYEQLLENGISTQTYINNFKRHHQVQDYKEYFAKRHAIYGMPANEMKAEDLEIYAKIGLINGQLLDLLGLEKILKYNMHRISSELQQLDKQEIYLGFLTKEVIESNLSKIQLLLADIHSPDFREDEVVQQARYILESITNSAGVLLLGTAKFAKHAEIITACYWVDEILQQARAKYEVT